MIIVIILAVCVAVSIGFFVWKGKKNKAAKSCSCGYKYTVDDVLSFRKEEKVMMMGGNQTSSVYVTVECPNCKSSSEKRIVVKYFSNGGQTVQDGIRNFFNGI